MNLFRKKIVSHLMIATFLVIAGGFCCGTSVFVSATSHDASIHYTMLDGNTMTIDSYTPPENGARQCHANVSGRIIDATTLSSMKSKLKILASDGNITDIYSEQATLAGDVMHDASALPPPRGDRLFSVIKKE